MKKHVFTLIALAALAALAGCHSPSQTPSDQTTLNNSPQTGDSGASAGDGSSQSGAAASSDGSQRIIATVRGHDVVITMAEIEGPLLKAYGLNILIREVELELAKEQARTLGIVVSEADIANERAQTLRLLRQSADEEQNPNALPSTEPTTDPSEMSDAEAEDVLQRLLAQQHVTAAEFDLTMETDAYLRKISEPELADKITDDMVRKGFNALYGEKARVRVISCTDARQANVMLYMLNHGDSFELLARNNNADPVASQMGGEYPPFTRQDPRFSESFKDVVFGLTPGQYSPSIIQEGNYYDIVKLEALIPPSIVKFEDYKDEIRKKMYEQATRALMQQKSNELGAEARNALVIKDPILAKQFADILSSGQHAEVSPEEQKRRWDAQHASGTTQPDMAPEPDAAPDAVAPSTQP
jgi:hypothetical protein